MPEGIKGEPSTEKTEARDLKKICPNLEVPDVLSLFEMSLEDLHGIWRRNHEKIFNFISEIGFEKIPYIATHGTGGEELEWMIGSSRIMDVAISKAKPENMEDTLRVLYAIFANAINYALSSPTRKIRLNYVILVFNCGTGRQPNNPNLSHNFYKKNVSPIIHSMRRYPIPGSPDEPLSSKNWKWADQELDSVEEEDFFKITKFLECAEEAGISSRALNGTPDEMQKISGDFFSLLTYKDNNELMDGYKNGLLERITIQTMIKKILDNFIQN